MNELVLQIMLLGICILEVVVGFGYFYVIVPDAIRRSKKNAILLFIIFAVLVYTLFTNRPLLFFSDGIWLMEIGLFSLGVLLCASRQKILLFEVSILYCSVVALLDFFFAFLTMGVLKEQFWNLVYFRTFTLWSVSIYLCTRVACLLFLIWLCKRPHNKVSIHRFKRLLLPVCGLLCILVRFFRILLLHIGKGAYDMKGWGVGIALLTFLLLLLILTVMMQRTGILQDENDILHIQDEMQQMRYQDLLTHGKENEQLLHDMRHHVAALQGYCEAEDMQGISQYLNDMGVTLQKSSGQCWTGHSALDALITQKKKQADAEEMVFDVRCEGVQEIPLKNDEIIILFGNLLDNAIEACRRTKIKNKFIEIRLRQVEQILYIDVANSMDEQLIINNNLILSSKREKQTYGYGLKSIKKIVEENDGLLSINVDGCVFNVSITFYM